MVEFFHLETDTHDVVMAEGAAAETYREDGNSPLFQNVAGRPPPPSPPYAPVLHDHPTVRRVWRRLSYRAGRQLALTEDPDLHLLADGSGWTPAGSAGGSGASACRRRSPTCASSRAPPSRR